MCGTIMIRNIIKKEDYFEKEKINLLNCTVLMNKIFIPKNSIQNDF